VTAPCLLKGQAIFLRGVIPENLARLNPLKIVEGVFLNQRDIDSAIVGKNIAEKLGLKPDDRLLFQGVFADRYAELQVKGIFTSNSIMDDEVLAPLHVGQWLRGIDYNHVTLIRLKIDRKTVTPNEIFKVVATEASQPSQPNQPNQPTQSSSSEPQLTAQEPIIPWVTARFSLEDVSVEEAAKYMKSYMDRYGVTREALLTLSAAVFLFSSSTIILASKTIVTQHKGEINILRALGMSKKLLKIDMLTKLSPWIMVASVAGVLIASVILTIIQGYGYLQVLSHTVPFQFDPLVAALNFILAFMLVSISVLKSAVE
jgi:ABC-type lipoprotein release transport system permease subunit